MFFVFVISFLIVVYLLFTAFSLEAPYLSSAIGNQGQIGSMNPVGFEDVSFLSVRLPKGWFGCKNLWGTVKALKGVEILLLMALFVNLIHLNRSPLERRFFPEMTGMHYVMREMLV